MPLIAEQEARQRALKNPPKPKPRPEQSPLYVEEGIYGQREVNEGPPSEFKHENLWRGVVEKQNIAMFAGAEKDDPTHAIIRLLVGDPFTGLLASRADGVDLLHISSAERSFRGKSR